MLHVPTAFYMTANFETVGLKVLQQKTGEFCAEGLGHNFLLKHHFLNVTL